jgi:hypothetical protein
MTDQLRQAAQQALEALIDAANVLSAPMFAEAVASLRTALAMHQVSDFAQAQEQQAKMRMPKVGDKVICLEDESLGEVVSLTAGGSPDITFDDGSRGTYLLREFAELFGYVAAPQQQAEPVYQWRKRGALLWHDGYPELKDYTEPLESRTLYTTPPQQQAEPICPECKAAVLYECVACSSNNYPPKQQAEPVAWDVFELRLYGAPQEKQHRVLWVDRYTYPDGSTPDLDSLLEAAKTEGGIDGRAKTLHVRPLYTAPPQRQWVGLTDEDFLEACQLAEHGNYLVALQRIQIKLKERNT